MKSKSLISGAVLLSILAIATSAFAQAEPVVPTTLTLSPFVVVTTLLSVVIGFVNQGINSGTILQNISLPKSWLPWLTILGSFLITSGASLKSSGVLTGASIGTAVMAGLLGLASAGGGAALQSHTVAHKDFAKKAAVKVAATIVLLFCIGSSETACTAAQLTAFDNAIASGNSALVPAENLSCTAASLLDPSGATAICGVIDASGAVIGTTFTVVEDVQSIVALLAKVPAPTAATTAKFSAFEHTLVAAKGAKKS